MPYSFFAVISNQRRVVKRKSETFGLQQHTATAIGANLSVTHTLVQFIQRVFKIDSNALSGTFCFSFIGVPAFEFGEC